MTSPETTDLRQRLARAITRRTGSATESSAVADAARRTHDELTAVFAPLISESGAEALSARAFDLARREYPADERRRDNSPVEQPFGEVMHWLARQAPSVATDAAAAMFATFAELLTALIGEELTTRYLQKAWPDAFSDAPRKGKEA